MPEIAEIIDHVFTHTKLSINRYPRGGRQYRHLGSLIQGADPQKIEEMGRRNLNHLATHRDYSGGPLGVEGISPRSGQLCRSHKRVLSARPCIQPDRLAGWEYLTSFSP